MIDFNNVELEMIHDALRRDIRESVQSLRKRQTNYKVLGYTYKMDRYEAKDLIVKNRIRMRIENEWGWTNSKFVKTLKSI